MKRFIVFALAGASLASCATIPSGGAPPGWDTGGGVENPAPTNVVTSIVETVTVPATQALIVANNAYQGAAAAVRLAAQNGALSPETARRLRTLNDRALELLEGGAAGLSLADRAAGVFNIVTEINGLIGRRN